MDSYSHSAPWDEDGSEGSGRVIRILEIGMLSVSFFLAAHLLSGGTPTVSAPNMGAFQVGNNRVQAAALAVPGAAGKEVIVDATGFSATSGAATGAPDAATGAALTSTEAQAPATEEIAVLAPPAAPETEAAAVAPPAPEPDPAPAVTEPAPAAPPAATVPEPAAPPAVLAGEDRYLTVDELQAAALAAGWPAELLPQVVAVARCESSFRTHAQYLGARGLMQVIPLWFDVAGLDPDMWSDPVTNLSAARYAYNDSIRLGVDGWANWTCKP